MRLLIIEDDRDAADYLVKAFREVGHIADQATDGEEGQAMALDGQYDVLIVDRMLPKRDGLSIIHTLRSKSIETPVLILSALGQVDDRVKGLRTGGDDYLAKPYAFSELLARVEALARRPGKRGEETVYRVGDLELNRLSHEVSRAGQELQLQPREFRLLEYLMRHAGQVDDRVKGLRAGGDDYLSKPYAFSELLARVEALARRRPKGAPEETVLRVADLTLDRLSHKVTRRAEEIVLQPREFRLLEYLMQNAGKVVTRTMLLEHVWDYHFDPQTNVIDVHVSRLRAKIDRDFDAPLLSTVRGAGYMIRDGAR